VEVPGPTIDNRYPAAPLTFERPGPATLCNPFTNGSIVSDPDAAGVPVTIRGVDLVEQVPAGDPVFAVTALTDFAACANLDQLTVVGNCTGATLPPYSDERPTACALGITFTGTTDHVATVRFRMEATCTDAGTSPCDAPAVQALAPTPAAPVTVRWDTSPGAVAACPAHPPEGAGGSCPPLADGG
jgi:hypothetical protein